MENFPLPFFPSEEKKRKKNNLERKRIRRKTSLVL